MIKENMKIKKINFPDFEEAFSKDNFGLNCDIYVNIGKYACQLRKTNCDRFTVAIGTDENPVYNKDNAVWSDVFAYRNNDDDLKEWYEAVRERVSEVWEEYVINEFMDYTGESKYQLKEDRGLAIVISTFTVFVIIMSIVGLSGVILVSINKEQTTKHTEDTKVNSNIVDNIEVRVGGTGYKLEPK